VADYRKGGTSQEGAIAISRAAAGHLRAALAQMDLLLSAEQVEAALPHLVALLQHLRAIRPDVP